MTPSDVASRARSESSSQAGIARVRSQSMSSDRPSVNGLHGLLSPPLSMSPEPVFVATSAASQIITNDHDTHAETWFDEHGIEPSGETALVAPPALRLVNRFLDQLLFNFLSVARSTSLASLRPAVGEVLKNKLSREAIAGADQELQEYLGGGEDEELLEFHNGHEPAEEWDLELIWKRTRLRCMVYSSLGDMEEEDEDYYTEQEQLDGPSGLTNRFSSSPEVVSPAVAIFLTSILEYMGEQVLVCAGLAAFHRLRSKLEREERDGTGSGTPRDTAIVERVVVEEMDMERVALDRTLGRLWRGWKKRVRSPTASISMSRSFSKESLGSLRQHSQPASVRPNADEIDEERRRPSLAAILADHEHAATVPLPLNANDVREIELPGFAAQSDDEEVDSEDEDIHLPNRPQSMMLPSALSQIVPSMMTITNAPRNVFAGSRSRSNSLPTPVSLPYKSAGKSVASKTGEDVDVTKNEIVASSAEPKGLVAGVMAGTVAMGAAAIAGIAAAANGEAPQTRLTKDDDYVEEFTEEPRIMTSSRISIGGRISPEEAAAAVAVPSRQSSIRSHSVHSLRVIEIASPRTTPSVDSPLRTPSVDASLARSISVTRSRPNSMHSPALVEVSSSRGDVPISRGLSASPLARNGSSLSSKQARNSAENSISEEQDGDEDSHLMTDVPSDVATAMSGIDLYPSPTPQQYTPVAPLSRELGTTPAKVLAPKSKAFVLAQPPPPRNAGRLKNAPVAVPVEPKSHGSAGIAPPLTPLRELMEVTPSTSELSNGYSPTMSSSSFTKNQQRTPKQQPPVMQRNSPARSREEISRKEVPRRPPTHASASSTSSTSHKHKPIRTSEDSIRPVEDKGRSFEQLIRSDQTIQYTLTPQNMRSIESPDSPRNSAQPVVVNAYDASRPETGRSHSSLSKHSTPQSPHQGQSGLRNASNTGVKIRPSPGQARDARANPISTNEFVDFLKLTSPPGAQELPARSTPPNGHRVTNSAGKSIPDSRSFQASKVLRRSGSSATRKRLQARDAIVSKGDSISDLIDFVRSGPQLNSSDHRIPRTVAPFRTTMDSDQMTGTVGGKTIDASLAEARTSQASNSVNSSVGSQTALLNSSRAKMNNSSIPRGPDFGEEEDLMPKRKQRRVRDMYQIDFSDEEEEYETLSAPKKAPPPKEESLADFLRNVPPPPESAPPPIFAELPATAGKKLKKKSSTSGFMSRFRRDTSSSSQNSSKPKSSGQDSRTPAYQASVTPSSRAPPSRAINSGQNGYEYQPCQAEPIRSNNYVAQVDSARKNDQPKPKAIQKSYQPREAIYSNTRTSDLASFLRDSEPPSAQTPTLRFATSGQKDESTFSKMRKKVY